MKEVRAYRTQMIGCAIGSAVLQLAGRGIYVSNENILYELERIAAESKDLQMKAFTLDAAKILRKACKIINN
ncbi:hypothetical protein [Candidatus Pantoea multigeneris]|uniref:Uncharacterized protein n=1 Tax=Candidatus Pantoea multigeneris TaxID=2608357 RepID=A0ABX0R994_9GAMM|nr:hypothetical protein [Pantoea multigeneris]NIF20244.1 hypothetical protein [Pantoea multigeneris]